MTEAEELELLELEQEQARAKQAPGPGTGKAYNPNSDVTETHVGFKLVAPSEKGNTTGRAKPERPSFEKRDEDPGPLATIGHQALSGFTKDNSDEAVGGLTRAMRGAFRDDPQGSGPDAQRMGRDQERETLAATQKHWPKLAAGAHMAGDIASDVAGMGLGLPMLSRSGLVGAGLARGYGGSDSEDALGQAVDTGIGGTVGYATHLLPKVPGAVRELGQNIEKTAVGSRLAGSELAKYFQTGADAAGGAISAGVSKVAAPVGSAIESLARWPGEALDRFAARRATSAAGIIQKDLNKLPLDAADSIGKELLDRKLIKPFRTAEELRPGIVNARREVGQEVGSALSKADATSGGSGPEVRRAVSARREVDDNLREAGRNSILFEAGKHDQRVARHADEAQDFIASLRSDLERNADGLGTKIEQDQQAARRFESLLGERAEQAPNRIQGEPALSSVPPKQRVKAAEALTPPSDSRALTKDLGFDAHGFIDGVRGRLLPELDDPALKSLRNQVETLLDGYQEKAARGLSHVEATRWKSNLQKTISKFQDAPISQQAKIRLQNILDDEIERSIGSKLGPEVLSKYQGDKRSYGLLKDAEKASAGATRRDVGNNRTGLTELLAMSAGATAGSTMGPIGVALGGPGAVLGSHLLRTRGASTAAVTARGVADAYLGILDRTPEVLGEFGAVIAREKTPEARLAMTQALAETNAAFAQKLDELKQKLAAGKGSKPDELAGAP